MSALSSIVRGYREQLVQQSAHTESAIRSAHKQMLASIHDHTDKLFKQMKDSGNPPLPLTWLYQQHRLQVTKSVVFNEAVHFGHVAQATIVKSQRVAAGIGVQSGVAQVGAVVGSGIAKSPDAKKSRDISPLFASFGPESASKVGKALVSGSSVGRKPDKIASQVDIALLTVLYRALTVARTELARSYRDAVLSTFQANDDTAVGWEWVAQVSACPFCLSMDGTKHSLDEEMESHPNCMCVQMMITV